MSNLVYTAHLNAGVTAHFNTYYTEDFDVGINIKYRLIAGVPSCA